MPLSFFFNLVFSLFTLIKGSFFVSVPLFFIIFVLTFVHSFFVKKFKLSWLKSTFLLSYVVFFILLILFYFGPFQSALGETTFTVFPEELKPQFQNILGFYVFTVFRLLLIALALTIMAIPFALFGSLILSFLKKRYSSQPFSAQLFVTVFLTSIVLSFFLLFLAPWINLGIFYLVYFGFT